MLGTQLRALGLLSVFGFNMTYMVKGPTDKQEPKSYSTIECRLLSHCYAKHDYNQMGPAAVSCICAPGFTGDLCEAQIEAPECGIEKCSEGCKAGPCDCSPKASDISNYLRACNITLHYEIDILNISAPETTGARTVWLRVWAERRDASALRTALARLVAMRTRSDRLRLLPSPLHFDMQPALGLHVSTPKVLISASLPPFQKPTFALSNTSSPSPDNSRTK